MTATMRPGILGFGTELDPESITISHHAKLRYLDRRGGRYPTVEWLDFAEGRLRDLLGRCGGQRPPVSVKDGRASRFFHSGGFVLVVSAGHDTLITMWRG